MKRLCFLRSGANSVGASTLIIVLASLAFLAALALAFLSSVGTELKSSKRYADSVGARLLAQSTFNLVTNQITEATKGGTPNNPLAWASQPGMIRTYDTTGSKTGYFKLYSWDTMQGTGAFDPTSSAEAVSATWFRDIALYTDLNQPLKVAGTAHYPIVDGNNLVANVKDTTGTIIIPGKAYDANSDNKWDIEGFNLSTSTPVDTVSASPNLAPMPVKWIYVLQDGTLVAPSSVDATGKIASFPAAKQPSSANPITGRMAFWTDDETTKVNINTASEGTYTDSPRLGTESKDDVDLRFNQPVNREYQRYPGHPAMTALSAVFPNLTKDQIFNIIPRISTGGSTGGTTQTAYLPGDVSVPMNPDADRLYASVDELFFTPNLDSGAAEPKPRLANLGLNKDTLRRAKFFLTASSRAPEVNLFGKPRISIWPLSVQESLGDYRSAYDSIIAFCGTMRPDLGASKYRYYFQREDTTDPTHDLPAAATLTGLGRNRMLMDYLKDLTSQSVPGFSSNASATFLQKYSASDINGTASGIALGAKERDQILTEIFDYIRATNLTDVTVSIKYAAKGGVVPIEDLATGTRGFGRDRTVQGCNLLFVGTDDYGTSATPPVASGNIRIQAMLLPQLFNVAVGSYFDLANTHLVIEGLDQFQWDNGSGMQSMGLANSVIADIPDNNEQSTPAKPWFDDGAAYGDQIGLREFMRQKDYGKLVSTTLDVPNPDPASSTFKFSGGDIRFMLYSPSGALIQTVVLRFPPAKFPTPKIASYSYTENSKGPYNLRRFDVRRGADRDARKAFVADTDVVRSVSTISGDVRLVAARKNPPKPDEAGYPFAPNAQYGDATTVKAPLTGAHNMWNGDGYPNLGSFAGRLVQGAGVNNLSSIFSDIPLNGVAVGKKTAFASGDIPGDWDTGVAELRDGPFINKPDEGDRGSTSGIKRPYVWKYHIGTQGLNAGLFTPNRLVASAGTFGSLPSGVLADKPWQTLLFRSGPAGHPGLGTPAGGKPPYTKLPDHLLLDLFWMPVVEPYAISEPFSTAGKINMNYQIVPFTYINRDTGIRAILKTEKVISMLTSTSSTYKANAAATVTPGLSRKNVDVEKTLTGFTNRFGTGDIFRSASEICDLDIVPSDYTGVNPPTRSSMDTYWNTRLLTGDNCRERPYATIYPRLTTQSNTFTIHARVQTLKKIPGTPVESWTEGKDQILGEYRGSQTIERYVDPNNPNIPDYADSTVNTPISTFYKTRVVASKQFAP